MVKFEERLSIGKRKIDIVANNELSPAINAAAVQAFTELLRSAPFIYIPHLRIRLLSKTDLSLRFLSFLIGLAKKGDSELTAYVDCDEIIANHVSELNVYLDVALLPLIIEHEQAAESYLKNLENFDIPEREKAFFVERLKDCVVHEATHIVHTLQSDFSAMRKAARKKLEDSLEGYALVENESERDFLKILRKDAQGISVSNERRFVEELFRSTRVSLRRFLDLLFSEGIAVYSSTQLQYPFDSGFLEERYGILAGAVENKVVKYIEVLGRMVKTYSEKTLKKKAHPMLPELDYSRMMEFEKTTRKMLSSLENSAYYIGPYMVYTTIFGNERVSLNALMVMNSYQFVKAYEDACSSLSIRPLVSLTSGHGIFDYKRAIEDLLAAAQYLKRV